LAVFMVLLNFSRRIPGR